jgi:hypothetical protein
MDTVCPMGEAGAHEPTTVSVPDAAAGAEKCTVTGTCKATAG